MVKRFLDFIKKHELCQDGDVVLLAVSGGVDSVVLCHLFHLSKIDFAIAHMNFALRGQDSIEDEKFVKILGEKYQIQVHTSLANPLEFAKQHGISIQMAARELRYTWFAELMSQFNYSSVSTAHHLNDSLETVLLNLTKGTGIAGLHGILPKNNFLIRPLLFATKQEIIDFAGTHGLAWREDISNNSNKYQRNLIRNKVVPLLKEINPSLESRFEQTLDKLQLLENFYNDEVARFKLNVFKQSEKEVYINIPDLLTTSNYKVLLLGALKEYGFHYEDLSQLIDGQFPENKTITSDNFKLFTNHNRLIILPNHDSQLVFKEVSIESKFVITKSVKIEFSIMDNTDISTLIKQKNIGCLDFETLHFPLIVRNWKDGDRFQPFGFKGLHKNVSDFLNESKVPFYKKKDVLVIESGEEIVWIVGYRIAEKYKVTAQTKRVYICSAQFIDS